ncbi:MAG: HD domain-containing protein [Lactobacillaceae bacterium]|jgi:uncharacterized protein|nr:HD domain-containing protein [Lactobacillaceae bacterium]
MLTTTEQQQLKAINKFATRVLASDNSGHAMDHIQRVVDLVKHLLLSQTSADEFVALAAGLLHDTYDDKLVADPVVGKQAVADFLAAQQVADAKQTEIFQIIDNMSWSEAMFGQPEPLSLAGKIVQDADRLDAIGAMGAIRTLQYGMAHQHVLYDPTKLPRQEMTKAEYRNNETIINHFYEKLFLIKDYLNTPEAKRIGQQRDQVMRAFVQAFEAEWAGQDYKIKGEKQGE